MFRDDFRNLYVSKEVSEFVHSARKTLSLGAAAVSDQIDAFRVLVETVRA